MGELFGSRQRAIPATQSVTPVMRMPVQSDMNRSAAAQTRRRLSSRSGRTSTMLSRRGMGMGTTESGTTSYSNSLLGQAG